MGFYCASFDSPAEYKKFILSHEDAVKTEKAAWVDAAKSGKKIWAYSESIPENEPDYESVVYFEFVDEDLNIYVDFFNRDTEAWIESYKFKDDKLAWTIKVDNIFCNDPLGLIKKGGDYHGNA